jgi:hypothetical protein
MPVIQVPVVVAALATIAQEVVLMINVHQVSTRQHLIMRRCLTVAIVALATIAQEVVLVISVHRVSTRQQLLI